MTRYEAGGRIIYVERHRLVSVLFFAAAVGIVSLGAFVDCAAGPDHEHWIPAFAYGVFLSLLAVGFLLSERAFVIDPAAGTLRLRHRGFFGRELDRRELRLGDVDVRTTSAETAFPLLELGSDRFSWIWLDLPGAKRLRFEGPIRTRERLRERVERLRDDLRA